MRAHVPPDRVPDTEASLPTFGHVGDRPRTFIMWAKISRVKK